MARRTKDAPKGGRVTPKGGPKPKTAPAPSGRYTPPVPKQYKESPKWVPILMLSLLALGMLTIVGNYLGLLPGGAKNAYLFVGLGFITCGFITATRYR
jgi:Cell division protein CrgA